VIIGQGQGRRGKQFFAAEFPRLLMRIDSRLRSRNLHLRRSGFSCYMLGQNQRKRSIKTMRRLSPGQGVDCVTSQNRVIRNLGDHISGNNSGQ
jgi:hypothetical protein